MKKLKLGFDIDGVLYSLVRGMRTYLCEFEGHCEEDLPDPVEWNFFDKWGLGYPRFQELLNEAQCFVFKAAGLPSIEKLKVLDSFAADGHEIHLVTSRYIPHETDDQISFYRQLRSYDATSSWLKNTKIPYTSLKICAAGDKANHVGGLDFYVDDYWGNLDDIKAVHSEIVTCLYRRPYNEQRRKDYLSVGGFCELRDVVDSLAAGNPAGSVRRAAETFQAIEPQGSACHA